MSTRKAVTKVATMVVAALIIGTPMAAQGPVSGQISIIERPGEQTEDLANTVVYLELQGGQKAKLTPTNEQMALQARQFAPHVRVNALCPGTTSEDGVLKHEAMRPLLDKVPLKRMGQAEETARAALFLASDASSYTTGNVLFADGGRTELVTPG